ncbi:hypothetical protein [Aeoliella sp.]|uniref:hypothetical protein n=1 Tax=Aeoliella sp. TaxID=2795800 RepID=UPI003CCB8E36
MSTATHIQGRIVASEFRNVEVETETGERVHAIVPIRWFSARGRFDMCGALPLSLRVRVKLREPPKPNRVVAVIDSDE